MKKITQTQLLELGATTLAGTLLELSVSYPVVKDRLDQLLATPEENIKRFKSKLTGLKRGCRFIDWRESGAFANDLEQLLHDLSISVKDPIAGVDLVGRFFELDESLFNRCDDSSGSLGDVFRYTAADLFVLYAQKNDKKQAIADLVLKLNQKDDYGIRDCLIERASEFLPKDILRSMVEKLWAAIEKETDEYQLRGLQNSIRMLARQLKDPILFEQTWKESGKIPTYAIIEIAQIYLDSGTPEQALLRLQTIPDNETFKQRERLQLLLDTYQILGDKQEETEIAWKIFKRYREKGALKQLLSLIGEDQKQHVIADELQQVFSVSEISYTDATFMLDMGCINELESYLLQRVDQLDGNLYSNLLRFSDAFEAQGKTLISSLIYRKLLDSILIRGIAKYYSHAIKYLRKLEILEPLVCDWQGHDTHQMYFSVLQEKHKRKSSFWSKYK